MAQTINIDLTINGKPLKIYIDDSATSQYDYAYVYHDAPILNDLNPNYLNGYYHISDQTANIDLTFPNNYQRYSSLKPYLKTTLDNAMHSVYGTYQHVTEVYYGGINVYSGAQQDFKYEKIDDEGKIALPSITSAYDSTYSQNYKLPNLSNNFIDFYFGRMPTLSEISGYLDPLKSIATAILQARGDYNSGDVVYWTGSNVTTGDIANSVTISWSDNPDRYTSTYGPNTPIETTVFLGSLVNTRHTFLLVDPQVFQRKIVPCLVDRFGNHLIINAVDNAFEEVTLQIANSSLGAVQTPDLPTLFLVDIVGVI